MKILNTEEVFKLFQEGRDHIADSQNMPAILRDRETHTHTYTAEVVEFYKDRSLCHTGHVLDMWIVIRSAALALGLIIHSQFN